MSDYIDRDGVLALGFDEADADQLLHAAYLTGYAGRPVVEADRLDELLEILRRERGDR